MRRAAAVLILYPHRPAGFEPVRSISVCNVFWVSNHDLNARYSRSPCEWAFLGPLLKQQFKLEPGVWSQCHLLPPHCETLWTCFNVSIFSWQQINFVYLFIGYAMGYGWMWHSFLCAVIPIRSQTACILSSGNQWGCCACSKARYFQPNPCRPRSRKVLVSSGVFQRLRLGTGGQSCHDIFEPIPILRHWILWSCLWFIHIEQRFSGLHMFEPGLKLYECPQNSKHDLRMQQNYLTSTSHVCPVFGFWQRTTKTDGFTAMVMVSCESAVEV